MWNNFFQLFLPFAIIYYDSHHLEICLNRVSTSATLILQLLLSAHVTSGLRKKSFSRVFSKLIEKTRLFFNITWFSEQNNVYFATFHCALLWNKFCFSHKFEFLMFSCNSFFLELFTSRNFVGRVVKIESIIGPIILKVLDEIKSQTIKEFKNAYFFLCFSVQFSDLLVEI